MASKMVEGASSSLVSAIKVVVLFGVLFAVIAFAKQQPDLFQTVVTKIGETAAALIIWVCDLIQQALPAPSSSGA